VYRSTAALGAPPIETPPATMILPELPSDVTVNDPVRDALYVSPVDDQVPSVGLKISASFTTVELAFPKTAIADPSDRRPNSAPPFHWRGLTIPGLTTCQVAPASRSVVP